MFWETMCHIKAPKTCFKYHLITLLLRIFEKLVGSDKRWVLCAFVKEKSFSQPSVTEGKQAARWTATAWAPSESQTGPDHETTFKNLCGPFVRYWQIYYKLLYFAKFFRKGRIKKCIIRSNIYNTSCTKQSRQVHRPFPYIQALN